MATNDEVQLPDLVEDRADFVFSTGDSFLPDGTRWYGELYPDPNRRDPLIYVLSHIISTNAVLHRRTVLENVGGFREDRPRAQEFDLHLRLAAAGISFAFLKATEGGDRQVDSRGGSGCAPHDG